MGLYPHAASPCGVEDLAGTTSEWCLNEYGDPKRIDPGGEVFRVLRGGSWLDSPESLAPRTAAGSFPAFATSAMGFGWCVSPPYSAERGFAGH